MVEQWYLVVFWNGTRAILSGREYTQDDIQRHEDGTCEIRPLLARYLVETNGKSVNRIVPVDVSYKEINVGDSPQAKADAEQKEQAEIRDKALKEIGTLFGGKFLPREKLPEHLQEYYNDYLLYYVTPQTRKMWLIAFMKEHGPISRQSCPDVLYRHYNKSLRIWWTKNTDRMKCTNPECDKAFWRGKNFNQFCKRLETGETPPKTCPHCGAVPEWSYQK